MTDHPTFPSVWNVPYRRNPFFTGREEILGRLHASLVADHAVALAHPQGINGLGGIGKTQTALEFAYRYAHEYQAVLWLRADSSIALISDFVTLAHLLRLSERDEADQRLIVEAVIRWLRTQTHWLLIFDNADDLGLVEPFIPLASRGHILLTTRAQALGGIANRLQVDKMLPDRGALLLLRRAGILPLDISLDQAVAADREVSLELAHLMDGLPLALDQAGTYIKETPCPLPAYLDLYQARQADLLKFRGSGQSGYPASVATTWSLSLEKVKQANPAAAELLYFCAFLSPDAIPEEIITDGAAALGSLLQAVAADALQLDRAIGEILRFSLLHRSSDEKTFSIHRLVQAVLKDAMDQNTQYRWKECALGAVSRVFPSAGFPNWQRCQRCLSHAQVCITYIEQQQWTFTEAVQLLDRTGSYLRQRSQLVDAEKFLVLALDIRERTLGDMHPDLAASLSSLGALYNAQGRYSEAESLFRRALAIREQRLGPTHLDVAASLTSLAGIYRILGRYPQAEPLYLRALAIREQELGPDHFHIASCLQNLGQLYYDQKMYTQAEPFYQKALTIWQQTLGPDQPDVAGCLNSLGELYRIQGKYAQAEPLLQHALTIYEQTLGPEHAGIVACLNNLALLYHQQKKYFQAEPLYKRALNICQQRRPEHPSVATCLNNLALLYYDQKMYAQAELLYQQALTIYQLALGPKHLDVASSLENLAAVYRAQGNYSQAEPLYQQALTIYQLALKPEHHDMLQFLDNLTSFYQEQNQYAQAEQLCKKVLHIYQRSLKPNHPDIAMRLNHLALLCCLQKKYTQAERLFIQALKIYEHIPGEERQLAFTLDQLAKLYHIQNLYGKAEPLYQRLLALYEKILAPDHLDLASTLKRYATLLWETKRESKAQEMFARAQSIRVEHTEENL